MDLFDDDEPVVKQEESSSEEDDDSDDDDDDSDEESEEEAPKASAKFGGRGRGRGAPFGRGGGGPPADEKPSWARKANDDEEGASPFGAMLKKSPRPSDMGGDGNNDDNVPQWKKDMEARKAASEAGSVTSGGDGDNVPQWKKDMEARKAAAAAASAGGGTAAGGGDNVPQWKKDMEARKAAAAASAGGGAAAGGGDNVPQWKKDMEARKAAAAGGSPATGGPPAAGGGGQANVLSPRTPTTEPVKLNNVGVFRQGVAKELEKMIDRHKYHVEDTISLGKEIITFQETIKEEVEQIEKIELSIEQKYLDQTKLMEIILTLEDFTRKNSSTSSKTIDKINKQLGILREQYLNTNSELNSAKQRLSEAKSFILKAEECFYVLDPTRKLGTEGIIDHSNQFEIICDSISALQVEDNQRKKVEKEEDEKIINDLFTKRQKEEYERRNRERKAKYDKPRGKRGGGRNDDDY